MSGPLLYANGAAPGAALSRQPSPLLARALPWLSVLLVSLLPGWLGIASLPLCPPAGLLLLVGWVLLRPGLLPPWSGLVLGLADDLVSGQPLGSAVLLWSLVVLALELLEFRLPWRSFLTEWGFAAALITLALLLGVVFANLAGGASRVTLVLPQIVASVLAWPLAARAVAWLDRARLVRLRRLD